MNDLDFSVLVTLLFVGFHLSVGIPPKYLTGDEDPPTCDGQKRTNPFPGKCGQRKGSFERRTREALNSGDVVGGRRALAGEFPWFVDMDLCGGTIVDELSIVTAAHCFDDADLKGDIVIAGLLHRMDIVKSSYDLKVYCGAQIRRIERVVKHPNYCSEDMKSRNLCPVSNQRDIAIVTVNRPFVFDKFVQKACLPDRKWDFKAGTNLRVVGNGYTNYHKQKLDDVLQSAFVPVVDLETCKEWLKGFGLTEDMMCAGHEKGVKDACSGDSGGPLFLTGNGGVAETTLVGVVSWGIDCGKPKMPGVYARTDIEWIKAHVQAQTSFLPEFLKREQSTQDAEPENASIQIKQSSISHLTAVAVLLWFQIL